MQGQAYPGSSGLGLEYNNFKNLLQTDSFEVEAVDLGDLLKIVIGHDRRGNGEGLFLERVVVQESPEEKEVLFECNR